MTDGLREPQDGLKYTETIHNRDLYLWDGENLYIKVISLHGIKRNKLNDSQNHQRKLVVFSCR